MKLVWTREEEFAWAYFRPAGVIDIKSASIPTDGSSRGRSTTGTRGTPDPDAVRHSANQRSVFHPSRSPLRQGSYRALAATANHYAREMHMDEMARALGVDAVEFRMRHLKDERMRNVLTAVAEKIGWPNREPANATRDRDPERRRWASPAAPRRAATSRPRRGLERRGAASRSIASSSRSNAARSSIRTGCTTRSKARSCRRSAARCSRPSILRRPAAQRDHGAVPGAPVQGRPAHRDHPAGPPRPAVGRSGGVAAHAVAPAIGSAVRGRESRDGAADRASPGGMPELFRH